ncbi:DUF4157 domain-containing protein [Marivirga sp. S37H4]|uniref:DUF4157 domain-containing protein n=1 Tax=Marivirga aurantiaca TaxID=2802615 RepID=A0A934WY92_9BACT|nr:DUF4157 domain-containing protein [Marivirga aurantiaca]MBK6265112.1 DUF4157 domain-containing protein [Marivirga aurantiaca]
MNTHANKKQQNKNQSVVNTIAQKKGGGEPAFQFVDKRPEAVAQRKLQQIANNSPQARQTAQLLGKVGSEDIQLKKEEEELVQKKENKTGLPDQLKTGIENLSDYSMDDVKVHRNSDKPAQLNAHAYAQGTDIHLASGQEKHLPHEAWHVVQQKQGRVKPTTQLKGKVNINDDEGLEKEADVMGAKALQFKQVEKDHFKSSIPSSVAQLYKAIDLDESQNWEDVREAFKAIKPRFIEEGDLGQEHFVMKYVEGPPLSSKLNVSEAGNLAINADGGSQHTVFFLAAGTLDQSNTDLEAANGDFRLTPTGIVVVVNNHPQQGSRSRLLQVEATPVEDKGVHWARDLETRCDLYYKNITKAHAGFVEIFSTSLAENDQGEISAERHQQLDQALANMRLTAGDAFEIKAFGAKSPGFGWNEHYAGIVAVDGADQVTLENYNRDGEFGEQAVVVATQKLGKNGQQIDDELSQLRKELKEKWFWEKAEKIRLNGAIADLVVLQQQWLTIMRDSRRSQVDTKHFKMYGPASKGQSFLDMWRGEMEMQQSKLSVANAERE